MKAPRKRTYPAIARLSRAAREIIEHAFLEGAGVRSGKSIIEEIKQKTGETIDDSAVYRYREYWLAVERPFIEARKEADGMLAALRANPTADVEELVKQRLTVAQLLSAKRFDETDPIELGYLAQGEKRIDLERKKIELAREKLTTEKERLEALRQQQGESSDSAAVFIELMNELARYLASNAQEALRQLQPHIRGFAAHMKLPADERIEKLGRQKGLDAETLKRIREDVYGITDPQQEKS